MDLEFSRLSCLCEPRSNLKHENETSFGLLWAERNFIFVPLKNQFGTTRIGRTKAVFFPSFFPGTIGAAGGTLWFLSVQNRRIKTVFFPDCLNGTEGTVFIPIKNQKCCLGFDRNTAKLLLLVIASVLVGELFCFKTTYSKKRFVNLY